MKIYISENTKGEYSITETEWKSSKHYNMTHFHDSIDDALDYIEEQQELVNYYRDR